MRAAYFRRTGAARDVFEVGELETPLPGPGEVRVRLRASGVNPSDTYTRSGSTRRPWSFPLIVPHSDGAGDIDRVGGGVPAARIGERVWVHNGQWKRAFGTAAEYIVLPVELASALPDSVPYEAGACLGIPALTAYCAVSLEGSVAGKTLLVQGGAGAVGRYAVQMAKLKGARVIATVSSDDKARHARDAGADHVVDYRREDVEARVRSIAPEGVDHVIEVNFSANAGLDAKVLKTSGSVIVYGSKEEGSLVPARTSIAKALAYRFFLVYELPLAARLAAIREITAWMNAGQLTHVVAARFPLERIAEAHEAVERGDAVGNVVVDLPT